MTNPLNSGFSFGGNMSDVVEFLYSPDDKETIENTLVSIFDTCCTDIDVTIRAYGIIKILDVTFEEDITPAKPYPINDAALVIEEVHDYIINFLREQIERLKREVATEENEYSKETFLNWIKQLKQILKKLEIKPIWHLSY